MAISANSYGTAEGVSARVPTLASNVGQFDFSTRPTLTQIESFIDQVSALINSILAQNRFAVPVAQSDVRKLLSGFVEGEVAGMAQGVNGFGRFGPNNERDRRTQYQIVLDDVTAFISGNAAGFEAMGATRLDQATNVRSVPVIRGDGYSRDLSTVDAERLE